MSQEIIEVAVGVLYAEDGRMLLSSRPQGKTYAGYWEFPGGKIESEESADQALHRELAEELGLTIDQTYPWFVTTFKYPECTVRLHFRRGYLHGQTPKGLEGQDFGLFDGKERTPGCLLKASEPVVNRAAMPMIFDQTSDYRTLSSQALAATVERPRETRWVGARVQTPDELYKAVALDLDYVIVKAEDFDALLAPSHEPLRPTYVEGVSCDTLEAWLKRGAHGVKPD